MLIIILMLPLSKRLLIKKYDDMIVEEFDRVFKTPTPYGGSLDLGDDLSYSVPRIYSSFHF